MAWINKNKSDDNPTYINESISEADPTWTKLSKYWLPAKFGIAKFGKSKFGKKIGQIWANETKH